MMGAAIRRRIQKPIRKRYDQVEKVEAMPLVILLVFYIIGFSVGNLVYIKAPEISQNVLSSFDSAFLRYIGGGIFQVFADTAKIYLAFELVIFLSGASVFGIILIPADITAYGVFAGLCCGFSMVSGDGKDVFLHLAAFMPFIIIFGTILCVIAKSSGFFSINLLSFTVNKILPIKPSLKKYVAANLIIVFSALICALFQSIMIKLILLFA